MNGNDLIEFCSNLFQAATNAREIKKGQPPEIGQIEIPRSKAIVEAIIEFAKNGGQLSVNTKSSELVSVEIVGQPIVHEDFVDVTLRGSLFGKPYTVNYPIKLPDQFTKDLCNGRWATKGKGQIKLGTTDLIPRVESVEGRNTAILKWTRDTAPSVRYAKRGLFGFLRWMSTTRIYQIVIDSEFGEIQATGLAGWVLPRLIWKVGE